MEEERKNVLAILGIKVSGVSRGPASTQAFPVAQANSRFLGCEDHALCARSSSLGMTELF
jgi:hypothetical protein